MKKSKTERGFELIEFKDHYENDCHLQMSSIILGDSERAWEHPGTSAVWLGTNENAMHLNREMVADIVKHLSSWLETGKF